MASLLSRGLRGRYALFGILLLSAGVSTAFFMKISVRSGFSSYAFSGLPIMLSYVLGGATGLLQKEEENPFHGYSLNIFKIY